MDQHITHQGHWKRKTPTGLKMAEQHDLGLQLSQEDGVHDRADHDNTFTSPPYNPRSPQAQYSQPSMPQTSTQSYAPGYIQGRAYPPPWESQSHQQGFNLASMPVFATGQTSSTVTSGSDTPQADWTPMLGRWLQESTSEEPFRAFTVPNSAGTDQLTQPTHQTYEHQTYVQQIRQLSATHGNSSKDKKGRGPRY